MTASLSSMMPLPLPEVINETHYTDSIINKDKGDWFTYLRTSQELWAISHFDDHHDYKMLVSICCPMWVIGPML